MYNIIIFGTGVTAKDVLYKLNDKCNIVCYLDNNKAMWGKFNGIEVKSPIAVKDLEYDFIIIASQFNDEIYEQLISLEVDRKKILQYYKVIDGEYNYIKDTFEKFLSNDKQYEIFATGISYCNLGLNESMLDRPCFKFAFGSQDIYYDYNIIKFIFDNYKFKCQKLKYCIIGLSYYSFQYDMSLSSIKSKVSLYYEVLGLLHNNLDISGISNDYFYSRNIADKIFRINESGKYVNKYDIIKSVPNYKTKEELGKIQAERDCNKNYPQTVEENKIIFKDYMNLLKENNIKPIIIIFPTTEYYYNFFSSRIENEFKRIMLQMSEEFDFEYLDLFRDNNFDNEKDFGDVSHLNNHGAQKIAKILNNFIKS